MSKQKNKIQITYSKLYNDVEVTGSCALLEIKVANNETKLLIDCGMLQKKMTTEKSIKLNRIARNMGDISGVIISHSHLS